MTSSAFDYGHEGDGFDEDVFERKFQEFVARKVQAVWRGKQQRKQYLAERRAAQFIQAQFRVSERKRLVRSAFDAHGQDETLSIFFIHFF